MNGFARLHLGLGCRRRRTTTAAGFAALLAVALGLAGCAAASSGTSHYTPAPATVQDSVDCLASPQWRPDYGPTDPASGLMGSVPAGFKPVDVVRCPLFLGTTPGPAGNPGQEEHFSGDYTALLAALSEPSDWQSSRSCTSEWVGIPDLWLVDAAGKAIHVMWPLDVCSKPKPGTAKALASLTVATQAPVTHFTPAPALVQAAADCMTTAHWYDGNGLADQSAANMGSIPAGFVPVSAVKCTPFGNNVTDSTGTWRTITQMQLSGDLGPLVKALNEPSDKAGEGLLCTADLEIIPDLWLVDASGKAVHVQWPLTSCRKSKPDTKEALEQLSVENTTVLKATRQTPPVPQSIPTPVAP